MIFGALRIRNESRWIKQVVRSIAPVCDEIFVLDDYSDDGTPDICEAEGCRVFRSPVAWVDNGTGKKVSDERAGKQWLLDRVFEAIPEEDHHFTKGHPGCPYWLLAIDGDEELVRQDVPIIRHLVTEPNAFSWALRILYLWDSPNHVRVDGVYRNFCRPSLFRLMNRQFQYQKTPFGNGANFHCSSIPQELIGGSRNSTARLLHWGYIDQELRMRKFDWYNKIDPNNTAEDGYRHMVVGDVFPRDSRFRHAGPLQLEPLEAISCTAA